MTLAPIDRQEAFRYMGCFGEPDPNLAALADQCERELIQKTHPGVIYRVLPLQRQDSRLLAGALELPGEDIRRLLQDCSRVLLMAATLSGQADQLIHRAGISDMTKALAMDAMASALESAANLLNESPYQKMLSDRYASFDAGKGKEFEEGKLSLEELVAYAKANGEPKQTSGQQELYEALVNIYSL